MRVVQDPELATRLHALVMGQTSVNGTTPPPPAAVAGTRRHPRRAHVRVDAVVRMAAAAGPLATADAVRPPTGLAGLVSWWNQQQAAAPPGEGGDLERSGDRDDVPARVRTGTLDDAVGSG